MSDTKKIRIGYAGSGTYNQLTAGSRFCNKATDSAGNHSQRGFLGGALYNENWEPSDGFCFKDFSVAGLTTSPDGNLESSMEALSPALEWKPGILLLQLNPHLDSQPEAYAQLMLQVIFAIQQQLPECSLYVVSPLPAGIPKCGPVVERSCEMAASFNNALKKAVEKAAGPKLSYIDLLAALDEASWKALLSGMAVPTGTFVSARTDINLGSYQWKLAQALLFGFFEDVEQLIYPDKAPSNPGKLVAVSPKSSTEGLPPSCDPDQGLIRDLPAGWWKTQLDTGTRLGKDCQLIFVGDSITHWWTNQSHIDDTYTAAGKNAFHKFFGAYENTTLNLGQASDTTADVLLRIREGALGAEPGTFNPKMVSILIGTNNIGNPNIQKQFGGPDNSRQLAQGIIQVILEVKRYCPEAKIVVTGILPTRIPYDLTRSKLEYTNYLVAQQAEKLGFNYLDMGEHMTNPDGSTIPEFYNKAEWDAARLHLCEASYELWASQLIKFLD